MNIFKGIALSAVAFGIGFSQPATAQSWQCVTFARSITDFSIRGNAHTWWHQAAGRYERGQTPQAGAILAMKANASSRLGHVAVVREVVSPRELRIDHANWTRRGAVERNARVIDVSPNNDWSQVRVSFGAGMGNRVNPVYGFIYAKNSSAPAVTPRTPFELARDVIELASLEAATLGSVG
jgi:surface antigen